MNQRERLPRQKVVYWLVAIGFIFVVFRFHENSPVSAQIVPTPTATPDLTSPAPIPESGGTIPIPPTATSDLTSPTPTPESGGTIPIPPTATASPTPGATPIPLPDEVPQGLKNLALEITGKPYGGDEIVVQVWDEETQSMITLTFEVPNGVLVDPITEINPDTGNAEFTGAWRIINMAEASSFYQEQVGVDQQGEAVYISVPSYPFGFESFPNEELEPESPNPGIMEEFFTTVIYNSQGYDANIQIIIVSPNEVDEFRQFAGIQSTGEIRATAADVESHEQEGVTYYVSIMNFIVKAEDEETRAQVAEVNTNDMMEGMTFLQQISGIEFTDDQYQTIETEIGPIEIQRVLPNSGTTYLTITIFQNDEGENTVQIDDANPDSRYNIGRPTNGVTVAGLKAEARIELDNQIFLPLVSGRLEPDPDVVDLSHGSDVAVQVGFTIYRFDGALKAGNLVIFR